MKLKIYFFLPMLVLSLFCVNISRACFPIKKQPQIAQTSVVTANASAPVDKRVITMNAGHVEKKHNFLSRLVHKAKDAILPQAVYIILAIFAFGWLAMGINDEFEGLNWLLSLLLYILFYFPGLIYTLIMMGDYY